MSTPRGPSRHVFAGSTVERSLNAALSALFVAETFDRDGAYHDLAAGALEFMLAALEAGDEVVLCGSGSSEQTGTPPSTAPTFPPPALLEELVKLGARRIRLQPPAVLPGPRDRQVFLEVEYPDGPKAQRWVLETHVDPSSNLAVERWSLVASGPGGKPPVRRGVE